MATERPGKGNDTERLQILYHNTRTHRGVSGEKKRRAMGYGNHTEQLQRKYRNWPRAGDRPLRELLREIFR